MTDKPLTKKQQVFIDEYLKCFNGAEAARRAGYSEKSARQTASDLLAESYISEQIQSRMAEIHMGADEAMKRLADMARGDITEFINTFGGIDIDAFKKSGKGHLIKKIKQKTIQKSGRTDTDEDVEVHETEIELYDAQAALDKILRVAGKYKDTLDVTSGGEKINKIVVEWMDVNGDNKTPPTS